MKVDGQLYAPAALPRTKISLFTLDSMLGGPQNPCQDSVSNCWVRMRGLYFLPACVIHTAEDGAGRKLQYPVSIDSLWITPYSNL